MRKLIFIFMGYLSFSCNSISTHDFGKEQKEILLLEAKQRACHFNKDAGAFVDMFSKDFLSVSKGVIDKPSVGDSYEKFKAYFNSVDFLKWDDRQEPIVRFSNDGSVAYVAVDKIVITKVTARDGKETVDSTNFAWLIVYKKYGNLWKIDCVTSTNR